MYSGKDEAERAAADREARRSGLLIAIAFGVIGSISLLRGHPGSARILLPAGAVVAALALFLLPVWRPVLRVWTWIARGLGLALTWLVLLAVHALLITPIGLARRLAGRPPLDTRWPGRQTTGWAPKESAPRTMDRYERPF
jgi:hypothetical protein